jgi:cyclopropane-fatty-acyl-phospholipid synthase
VTSLTVRDLPSRILARHVAIPACVAIHSADGTVALIGQGEPTFEVRVINVAGMAALRSLNELKICEAYIRGDLDFEGDLIRALELRQILSDRQRLIRLWARLQPRLLGRRRLNPEWVAKHYDSNNIQLLAVDKTFNTYTPGIYETENDTLEDGAARKLEAAFHALRLKPGDTVLDVGCGWGGFLRFCAREGVSATGITLSRHQLDFARQRLREDGLRATVLYQDFFSFAPAQRFTGISMMGVLEDLSDYPFRPATDHQMAESRGFGLLRLRGGQPPIPDPEFRHETRLAGRLQVGLHVGARRSRFRIGIRDPRSPQRPSELSNMGEGWARSLAREEG